MNKAVRGGSATPTTCVHDTQHNTRTTTSSERQAHHARAERPGPRASIAVAGFRRLPTP